jgi:hypothetical protein
MFSLNQVDNIINNVALTNPDGRTGCTAFSINHSTVSRCKVNGFNTFVNDGSFCLYAFCDISTTSTAYNGSYSLAVFCDFHDGGGIQLNIAARAAHCNFYNISATAFAVDLASDTSAVFNCNFYHLTCTTGGTTAAINIFHYANLVVNCVIEDVNPSSQVGYAFNRSSAGNEVYQMNFINCFYYNVKTAAYPPAKVAPANLYGLTALSASPFTNPGAGDFSPNNTAGGGALIRATGLPTTFPAGTTVNALDAGAVQHTAGASGGAMHLAGRGGGLVG